jgi:hypothetical protein
MAMRSGRGTWGDSERSLEGGKEFLLEGLLVGQTSLAPHVAAFFKIADFEFQGSQCFVSFDGLGSPFGFTLESPF